MEIIKTFKEHLKSKKNWNTDDILAIYDKLHATKLNKFKFVVGDWSGDGHNLTETFYLESNMTQEEIREIYFETKEKTTNAIDEICIDFEENILYKEDFESLGLDYRKYLSKMDKETENTFCIYPSTYVYMMVDYLKLFNEDLVLNVINEGLDSLFNTGYDKDNRMLKGFGYGLFSL